MLSIQGYHDFFSILIYFLIEKKQKKKAIILITAFSNFEVYKLKNLIARVMYVFTFANPIITKKITVDQKSAFTIILRCLGVVVMPKRRQIVSITILQIKVIKTSATCKSALIILVKKISIV
ncbi:hypothetical protein HMPREF3209_00079 [Lactobacillus crispatus]|nr:hypothetical protein HMPREF3209_00079 [Lactobacillus crispatus]